MFPNLFLIDDTIKNNIAFGAKNIDYKMLDYAIKSSGLYEFINKSKDGIETFVGERELNYQVVKNKELELQEHYIRIQIF